MDTILTLKETQQRLRIGKTALRRLINQDPDFKTLKLGHRRVVAEQDLEAFIQKKRSATP